MAITETTFGPKTYLTLKKSIMISQITDKNMYDEAGKKLGGYMAQHGVTPAGPWSVLYFMWDQAGGKADIGIAFPVEGLEGVEDTELSIIHIPECKAATDVLQGSYEGLAEVHKGLMQYATEQAYNGTGLPVMAVEEYIVDPMKDPNSANWVTNIYYLHN